MALGIQVFGIVFGAFMLYMTFLQWKKREFTFNEWAFWSLFALTFSGVSLFPQVLDPVIAVLELGRKLDLFIIIGFMFLIAATFYTYRVVRKVQKGLDELVRQLALERAQEPDLFRKKVNQKTKTGKKREKQK
ncbi:DUF2304 domain-containing protein [Candidatus Woesearchaeota archaeon]|nr:DUF2304 domain-containing protein [Candidatus Woesearchaeota archaeon]